MKLNEPKISLIVFLLGLALILGLSVFGALKIKKPVEFGSAPLLSKEIDGKLKNIEYTDDNTNEGLIIRTVSDEVMGFAGNVVVIFSVHNTGQDQDVRLAFSFDNDYDLSLSEYGGETVEQKLIFPAREATATTTAMEAVYDTVTTTTWVPLSKKDFEDKQIERKNIKNKKTLKENTTHILSGETKFFKAIIKYIPTGREEFIIEAFGDYDYGHLI